jgi:hypothetical protein
LLARRFRRLALEATAVAVALGACTASASASISPGLSLNQATTQAGTNPTSLGLDLSFNPSSGDAVKDFELVLPPGLLANANVDGGACLISTTPIPACQIGTGTITAGGSPTSVELSLVRPQHSGDIAGVAVTSGTTPLATADVTVRPVSSPQGAGLDVSLANIPASLDISAANLTFTNIRMPDRCPTTPADVIVTADSQEAPGTVTSASAPLQVTGCAALAPSYQPGYGVAVQKDASDQGVGIVTAVTETAAEETTRVVTLVIPSNLAPDTSAAFDVLCATPNASFSNCTPVGSAQLATPLLPARVPGAVYLTESGGGFALTLDFPSIDLVLSGTIDLANDSVTFDGVPDVPLTSLVVALNGGTNALFETSCNPSSATATARFTDQNGDKTVTDAAPFTIKGCSAAPPPPAVGKPTVSRPSLGGLSAFRAHLAFRLSAGRNAPEIALFTVKLPNGLSFVRARLRKGVALGGAAASLRLSGGRLVVALSAPAARLIVKISRGAIRVSRKLALAARRRKPRRLTIAVGVTDVSGTSSQLRLTFRHPR